MFKKLVIFLLAMTINKISLSKTLATPSWMTEAILKTFKDMVHSSGIDEQVVSDIASLCEWTNANKEICSLEKRVTDFKIRLNGVYNLEELIIYGSPATPWDIRQLVIGEVLVLPSFDGPESTLNNMARVLFERRSLLYALNKTKTELHKLAPKPAPMALRLKIPRLQSAIFSASPIGEIVSFDHYVTCPKSDSACKLYESAVQRFAHASVRPYLKEIKNLIRRFDDGVSTASEERVRVISKQLELAKKIQNLNEPLTQSEILESLLEIQSIKALDPSPLGAGDLLNQLQVLAELNLAKTFIESIRTKKLSGEEEQRLMEITKPFYDDSIHAIDAGLKLLGLEIEVYD